MKNTVFDRSVGAAINNMKIYCGAIGVMALVAAVLRSVAYIVSFDPNVGYFNGSFLVSAVNALSVIACAFAFSGFYFINRKASLSRTLVSSPNSVFFASAFAGFIMIADFAYKLFAMIGNDRFEYYAFIFKAGFNAENTYLLRATAIIEIFGALSSLASAIWFFLRASKKQRNLICAIFGFFPVFRALAGIANVYFDMTVQMNHPSKLFLQLTMIAIMFYLLCEQRFLVSENHPRPLRYFVFGCIAVFFSFSVGASEMVGFFAGQLDKGSFCIEAFFCLTLSFYILARLVSFVKDSAALPSETEEENCVSENCE